MNCDVPGGAPDPDDPTLAGVSRFFAAADGLQLHMRDYGEGASARLPVVCLPGLARTAADFDLPARRLAAQGRRVLAFDYRGRGRSGRDPDWRNYSLPVENADLQTGLAAYGVERAVFVGTSRGGLHIMGLAVLRPDVVHAAVLNDIGPKIETAGLERIRGYVGKLPPPKSWREATEMMRRLLGPAFCGLSDADVESYAHLTLREENGSFAPRYDIRLIDQLALMNLSEPLPILWDQFAALNGAPLLAIRGENSDLLSAETLAEMATRHPHCETFVVAGQGHAPLLTDEPTLARIAAFVVACDTGAA